MASTVYLTTAAVMVAMLLLLWTPPGYGQIRWKKDIQCFQEKHNGEFDMEAFNIALFKEVSLNTNSSVFMSPYSIWSAFVLVYFGSEGTTKGQLQTALGVTGKKSVYIKWKIKENLLEKPGQQNGAIFRSLNKAYFDNSITLKGCISELIHNLEEVNFGNKMAAANLINEEVRRTTEGMIPNLIQPGELSETLMILLNAVYFKGKWDSKFELKDTERRNFYDEQANKNVLGKVDMMIGKKNKAQLGRNSRLGADIVAIPYDNSSISMIFIKPSSRDVTVDSILSQLTSNILQDAMSEMIRIPVKLGIPRFRMETEIKGALVKAMNALGVSDIFSERADLSGFSNTKLKVDKVIHKAVIEVSEEGTKAAAATEIQIVPLSFIPTPEIIFDRPFIFLIHDKSANVTLFAGTYRHPNDAMSLS